MAAESAASVVQVNPSKFLYWSAIMTTSTFSSRTLGVSRSCTASQWLRLICKTFSAIFGDKLGTPSPEHPLLPGTWVVFLHTWSLQSTARLPAFGFVALCAPFNAAVGSVYLCVSVFRDVAVLSALEALGGLHDFTYLAARPIHADRGFLKQLSSLGQIGPFS